MILRRTTDLGLFRVSERWTESGDIFDGTRKIYFHGQVIIAKNIMGWGWGFDKVEGVANKKKIRFSREELKKKGLPVALIASTYIESYC